VPPAMNRAEGSDEIASMASATSVTRVYAKEFISHRLEDGGHDLRIGAAPAEVAAHQFANVLPGGRPSLADQSHGRADLARCAIAALESVLIDEGLLHGMQPTILGEPLDGGDLRAVLHDGEGKTGVDAHAVHQHGAGATLAVITPLLGPGQPEMVTECVEQRSPGRDGEPPDGAIHLEDDLCLARRDNVHARVNRHESPFSTFQRSPP